MSVTGGRMRIGEVHALLRQDYPDIELSKIRYYEDKGLVEPSRSRKGYRLYSERDVACLREAIRLAHEEFVPLRVVRLRLIEQGLLDEGGPGPTTRAVARDAATATVVAPVPARPERALTAVPAATLDDPVPAYLRPSEFCDRLGLDPSILNTLIATGTLVVTTRGDESVLEGGDLELARAAGVLIAQGLDPRVLGALRRNVERELGVVEEIVEAGGPRAQRSMRQVAD
ncbi:MAG: MerR family transcriptional regulator, partial [Acidobacteriota bacterium]|nr:MerR family transcriptional regulator [Acidobacteriota bacterium]